MYAHVCWQRRVDFLLFECMALCININAIWTLAEFYIFVKLSCNLFSGVRRFPHFHTAAEISVFWLISPPAYRSQSLWPHFIPATAQRLGPGADSLDWCVRASANKNARSRNSSHCSTGSATWFVTGESDYCSVPDYRSVVTNTAGEDIPTRCVWISQAYS